MGMSDVDIERHNLECHYCHRPVEDFYYQKKKMTIPAEVFADLGVKSFKVPLCAHCFSRAHYESQREWNPLDDLQPPPPAPWRFAGEAPPALVPVESVQLGQCDFCKQQINLGLDNWWRSTEFWQFHVRSHKLGRLVCARCWNHFKEQFHWTEPYRTTQSETELRVAIVEDVKKNVLHNAAQAITDNRQLREDLARAEANAKYLNHALAEERAERAKKAPKQLVDPNAQQVAIASVLAIGAVSAACALVQSPVALAAALVGTLAGYGIFLYNKATEVLDGK